MFLNRNMFMDKHTIRNKVPCYTGERWEIQEERQMDSSFNMTMGGLLLVIGAVMALCFYGVLYAYRKMNRVLNQAHLLSGQCQGTIKELVVVKHRNRSFRWKNEYPLISYTVNGTEYETAIDFAEKRAGKYDPNAVYTVCYLPEDPSVCIVEEFRTKMQKSCKAKLVGMVVFGILTFNIVFYAISLFLS